MQRGDGGGSRRVRRQHTRSCAPRTPPCRFGRKPVPSRTLGRVSTSSHALTRDPRGGCYPEREFTGVPRCNTRKLWKSWSILAPAPCARNIRTETWFWAGDENPGARRQVRVSGVVDRCWGVLDLRAWVCLYSTNTRPRLR